MAVPVMMMMLLGAPGQKEMEGRKRGLESRSVPKEKDRETES